MLKFGTAAQRLDFKKTTLEGISITEGEDRKNLKNLNARSIGSEVVPFWGSLIGS